MSHSSTATVTRLARSLSLTREQAERAVAHPDALNGFRDLTNAYLRSEVDPEFFAKWNVVPSPLVLDAGEADDLFAQALALHDAVEFVLDRYVEGDPEVRALYERYHALERWFVKPGSRWQGWGRYDFLLGTDGRPVFVETNAAMASGFLPMNHLNAHFREHAPEVLLPRGAHVALPYDDYARAGEAVLAQGRDAGMKDGTVAILIGVNKKFHEAGMLVKSLHAAGCADAVVASIDDVTEHDGRLWVYGRPISIAFMKIRLFGAVHSWSEQMFQAHRWFFDASARHEIVPINCLAAETLAEDKVVFAAMRLQSVLEDMPARLRHVVENHTVPTYPLAAGPVILDGEEVELLEVIRADRANWMLKPRNDYRGSGVTSGRTVGADEWNALIGEHVGRGDFLAQRRVDHEDLPIALPDGTGAHLAGFNLAGGVYVAGGACHGLVARAGDGEVVNGITGARMLPVWATRG